MTICGYCNKDREEDDFSWRNKKLGTRNKKCKICQREYAKLHYQNNKEKYSDKSVKRNKEERNKKKLFIDSFKVDGCTKCDEDELCCLEFHHIDPDKKSFRLSQGTSKSLELLVEEISKCVVLCANCHRKVHAGVMGL